MKTKIIFVASALIAAVAFGEVTSGWQAGLGGGTYSWEDENNWVGGVANGLFSNGVVGSGKTYPTITFSQNETLYDPLILAYTNGEQYLVFKGTGGDRTLTLPGLDVAIRGNTAKGGITFGATSSGSDLNLNFTDPAVITLDSRGFTMYGTITGNIDVTGKPDAETLIYLAGNRGNVAAGGSLSFTTGKGLYIYSKDSNTTGCRRVDDVTIRSGLLVYEGNSGAAAEDSIGTLRIAPGNDAGGTMRFHNWGGPGTKNAHLSIGRLVRERYAGIDFHSYNHLLGHGEIGDVGSVNITVDEGVEAIGTGAAGTPGVPVVPWARGNDGASNTGDSMFNALVTYDDDRGFRLLDAATEYDTYEAGYAGAVTSVCANVRVTSGTVDLRGDNTVNSISMLTSSAATLVATTGVTRVMSGAVDMTCWNNSNLRADLDFGDVTGYISQCANKNADLYGSISGVDVVFMDNALRYTNGNAPLTVHSVGYFTGDCYVNGQISMAMRSFLPNGDRTGDTYVAGRIRIFCDGVIVNGLYGAGNIIFNNSYTTYLTVGDNDADGDFPGTILFNGGTPTLNKIGSGRQRFGGSVNVKTAIKIKEGTAIFDGAVSGGAVSVSDGAAIGGNGSFAQAVSSLGAMTLAVPVADDGTLSCIDFDGGFTSAGAVTVEMDSEWSGTQCIARSATSLAGVNFVKGESVAMLSLENGGTELWATRRIPTTIMVY